MTEPFTYQGETVAPFAGAWIEITQDILNGGLTAVAPFAGAWIEMLWYKFARSQYFVAPFAGAWIEINV